MGTKLIIYFFIYKMNKYDDESEKLINLLEYDPMKYYIELCNLKKKYTKKEIKKILDMTQYICYMGHHLHALIYVVGDLINNKNTCVYGTKIAVSEDLGIKILEKLIKYNIDLNLKNYYEQTPLQNLYDKETLTARKNNNKFKKKLKDYYIDRLNKNLIKDMKKN